MPMSASTTLKALVVILFALVQTSHQLEEWQTVNVLAQHWPTLEWPPADSYSPCEDFPGLECFASGEYIKSINLSNKGLNGTIPSEIRNITALNTLDLSNNQLTGTIPISLENLSQIVEVYLHSNKLSGELPSWFERLTNLRIECNQHLDVCTTAMTHHYEDGCKVDDSMCNLRWEDNNCDIQTQSQCTNYEAPIPTPVPVPVPVPIFVPVLIPVPVPIPASPHIGCIAPPPQPSDYFLCKNGEWVSNRSVEVPTIQVSGNTKIEGNLTVTTITLNGLDSSIIVNGCIELTGSKVVINLTPEEFEEMVKTKDTSRMQALLQQNGNCTQDFSNVAAEIHGGESRCDRITASTQHESIQTDFSVLFKVNSKNCNLWWIILASVLGGCLIIAVIGAIVISNYRRTKLKKPANQNKMNE